MKILAFDTTNQTLSVAVLEDKHILAKRDIFEENKHSEMLIPVIEECLKEAAIWYQNLDLIAFTNGPGSFTGIRVGLACAKALAIATNLPVVAVNSLEAIAYGHLDRNPDENRDPLFKNVWIPTFVGMTATNRTKILVVNDARLEEFFIQEFLIENNQLKPSFEPMIIGVDEIENFVPKEQFLLAGSAKNMIKVDLKNAVILPEEDFIDAKNIAFLAQEKYLKNKNLNASALYIRKPKISQRKK